MKLFISWSKSTSRQLAELLRDWLPEVIQQIEPWISRDIEKGALWNQDLANQLASVEESIVCVTPSNWREPWLNFEAGALARTVPSSVRPVLLGLPSAELVGPLALFQVRQATDADDMKRLLRSLNLRCERKLTDEILSRAFERTWPDFIRQVEGIRPDEPTAQRTPEDMLAEVVELVREINIRQDGTRMDPRPYGSTQSFVSPPNVRIQDVQW